MAFSGQMDFQDASSPIMQELMTFHDHALMIIFMICTLILYMISILVKSEYTNKFTLDAQTIEIIWTVIPAAILVTMALPSLNILYEMDENNNPLLTIKATAHQWYWTYEYTDFNELMFDAFMTPTESLYEANFRLLETDNRVELCYLQPIRVVVTSEDVLHSWAVPSLGQKVDAIPGRLNQSSFCPTRLGIFYGQCSEICGANHSFMPIVIETLPFPLFQDWTLYKH